MVRRRGRFDRPGRSLEIGLPLWPNPFGHLDPHLRGGRCRAERNAAAHVQTQPASLALSSAVITQIHRRRFETVRPNPSDLGVRGREPLQASIRERAKCHAQGRNHCIARRGFRERLHDR